jgi:hypothetical protein
VRTRFVALLNNDAIADPTWLEASLSRFEEPEVAAVASKILLLEGPSSTSAPPRVNNAGVVLLASGYGADRGLGEPDGQGTDEPVEVFGFSGGAAVLRTLAVRAVGGIASEWFMYYEDTDLSWRLRLSGWQIVYEPTAVVHHRHAASSDVRSESFAFFNERNRLLTLVRNAPFSVTATQVGRFVVTTLSLAAKRTARRTVPPDPVFRVALRLRVLGSVAAMLPSVLELRAPLPAHTRRRVWSEWAGVPVRLASRVLS